ncbi:uncharacterized protein [Castor canadensis]|uniref:Uncharacterized protein n=1 Tax=Castor canadensis TaxID=51338 RepID=A0AC58LAQ5_CASCN
MSIGLELSPGKTFRAVPGYAPPLAPDRPRHPQPCLIVSQGDHGPVPSPSNKLLFPSGPPGSVLSLSCWWEKRTVLPTSQCPLSCPAASASTWTTWSLHSLISSQSQSPVPQTGEASRAPPAKLQNSTLLSGPAASTALVPVFSGLLVIKSLGLSALLLWTLRIHAYYTDRTLSAHLSLGPRPKCTYLSHRTRGLQSLLPPWYQREIQEPAFPSGPGAAALPQNQLPEAESL